MILPKHLRQQQPVYIPFHVFRHAIDLGNRLRQAVQPVVTVPVKKELLLLDLGAGPAVIRTVLIEIVSDQLLDLSAEMIP